MARPSDLDDAMYYLATMACLGVMFTLYALVYLP